MALSKNEKKIIKLIVIVLLIIVAWQLFSKTLVLVFGGLGSLVALLVLLGLAYYLLVKERWLDKI
ncbi:MAG TPA: hypothetical protein VJI71_02585 [Candidatus Norongarragalinales archaeon]|nr:hypothetical protein [Candidatus Norongarragalinales archaeon]